MAFRRVLLALFSAVAFVPASFAQTPGFSSVPIVLNHDFDDVAPTYCILGPDFDSSKQGLGNVKTAGSNATVTAATGTPFAGLAKGSVITVRPGSAGAGLPQERYVLAVGSSSSLTINTATDWSGNGTAGFPWTYKNLTCGTGLGAGWFSVSGYSEKAIHFQIDQLVLASGSVAVTIQCKGSSVWSSPTPVYPPSAPASTGQCDTGLFTTAGATARCIVPLAFNTSVCRLGVALTDDVDDTGTNLEQVTATLEGRK